MTTTRSRTIMVLVAAVLVLLASVGTAIGVAASRDRGSVDQREDYASRYEDGDSGPGDAWMSDPGPGDRGWGGSMMGERSDGYGYGYGSMMDPRSSGRGWTGHAPGPGWSDDGWGTRGSMDGTEPAR